MKTISKLVLALLLVGSLSTSAVAHDSIIPTPETSLQTQISKMMSGVVLPSPQNHEAQVKFLVNGDNQLVVISVDTEDERIESLIKNRLNYKEVESVDTPYYKINKIKITLKQPRS